nr:Dam family site-specific DNA-(adenine-N6)-methyltransferase [uncultured Nocardioides sp.]
MDVGIRTSPFLRWAGSKRWLIDRILELVPTEYGTYYEPFLGSGAVFFSCTSGRPARLSDTISPLINCYLQVRRDADAVADMAESWSVDSETYYKIRATEFEDEVSQAAQFIYLNKTCYNGLYRENQLGRFNVPFGRPKTSRVLDRVSLAEASAKLAAPGVTIRAQDFEETLETCGAGDVAYLDPPYVAGHRQNGFVDYNAKLFSWEDQRRLADVCRRISTRGAAVIVSNADHPSVRELFNDEHFRLIQVSRYSSMAARSGRRGTSDELLIVSNALKGQMVR